MARENARTLPALLPWTFRRSAPARSHLRRQGARRRPPRAGSETRQRGDGRQVRNDGPVRWGGFR